MGVRDLNYLIKRYNRSSIKELTLHDLKNKRLAIDLQLYLYKALIQNKNPVEEIHKQILHLERYKITPIYVFDGKPPKEKIDELHYRLNYTYKLSVVKNRDANKSILARVKWQYKYKGEYRKPAYIGVYIGSLKDFPKGLNENNIDEVAKLKIEEYFKNKIPIILQDIYGNEYQL